MLNYERYVYTYIHINISDQAYFIINKNAPNTKQTLMSSSQGLSLLHAGSSRWNEQAAFSAISCFLLFEILYPLESLHVCTGLGSLYSLKTTVLANWKINAYKHDRMVTCLNGRPSYAHSQPPASLNRINT